MTTSYVLITQRLTCQRMRFQVIDGESTIFKGNNTSSLVIAHGSAHVGDETEQSQQQGSEGFLPSIHLFDPRFLTPKGPLPKEAKLFKEFLQVLAKSLGCSVKLLEEKGYRCQLLAKDKVVIHIPDAAHQALFKEFSKGAPLAKLLKQPPSSQPEIDHSPLAIPRLGR